MGRIDFEGHESLHILKMQSSISVAPGVQVLDPPFADSREMRVGIKENRRSLTLSFVLACAAVLFWHIFLMVRAPVIGDEAYYWLWSKHLAWGYHDHPPLIGWLIAASTAFSNATFWVRFPALVCFILASVVFYLLAGEFLPNQSRAIRTLLFFLYIPILATSTVAVFTDTPLLLSWILCMWASWKAQKNPRYWLLAGTAVGLSILSKLIGVFLPASLALFFFLNRQARSNLARREFQIGAALAMLIPLPVWIWNLRHGFENFVFQAHDHLSIHPVHPFTSFLGYVGVQSLCVSPFLFLLMVAAFVILIRESAKGDVVSQFLLAFALPIHLFFGLLPFWARVGVHWAAPGYLALLIAAIRFRPFDRWQTLSLGVAMIMTLFFYTAFAYPREAARLVLPLETRHPGWHIASFFEGKGYGEILGYESLAQRVGDQVSRVGPEDPAFILTDSYTLSSDLTYYTGKPTHTILMTGQGGEFARWDDFEKLRGNNALFVSLSPIAQDSEEAIKLNHAFLRAGRTEPIEIQDGPVNRTFYLTWFSDLSHPEFLRSDHSDVRY